MLVGQGSIHAQSDLDILEGRLGVLFNDRHRYLVVGWSGGSKAERGRRIFVRYFRRKDVWDSLSRNH